MRIVDVQFLARFDYLLADGVTLHRRRDQVVPKTRFQFLRSKGGSKTEVLLLQAIIRHFDH